MTDKQRTKKEEESESLDYFLEAYELATGISMAAVLPSERPDFLCEKPDGELVGIELVRIRREHPEEFLWDRILEKTAYMSVDAAISKIQVAIVEKDFKRRNGNWRLAESTILLVQLTDIPLAELAGAITPDIFPDLSEVGFSEVWLADYTGLEAYDDIELYCIHPSEFLGRYRRLSSKPYG